MKMQFWSTPRKIPIIKSTPIHIQPIHNNNNNNNGEPNIASYYLFSSMLDRVQKIEGCSACGRK